MLTLPQYCDGHQIVALPAHVRFTPNSDRDREFAQKVMSAYR